MTLYELAKRAGIKHPQHLYNLAKSGVIKTTETECVTCGHKSRQVSDEDAAKYLEGRKTRMLKNEQAVAELKAEIRAEVLAELEAENNS
jgi:Zn ribbon nucleic-acid-binding protein